MKLLVLSSLFFYDLNVAANPLRRAVNNEADITTIVTVTSTLYATLVPPVLPAVTVTTIRTQSVYTATSTLASMLNCTTTLYTPIAAPSSITTAIAPPTISNPTTKASPALLERQVSTKTSSTVAPTSVTSSSTEAVITSIIHTTITATTSQPQRPPITRTIYASTLTTTEANPLVRTAYACTATLEVFYSIVTNLVTSTISRTYWPSTTTLTSYTDCAAKTTTPATTKTSALMLRQVAPSTVLFSTTQTQTRVSYVVTTISETGPSVRVIRTCSPTASSIAGA